MMRDANRFILYSRYIIENAPLQVYASALVFSPTMSRMRMLFQDKEPPWISTSPIMQNNWNPCLQILEGHTDWARSVAFSPDGRRLVSTSDDDTVRVWNAETGALQQTLEGHTDWVWSVAFSPDGRRLASASCDKTVRIWDAETGVLQQTLEDHIDWVLSVAFSPDGRRLASASGDTTVRIWDTGSDTLQQTLEGHTALVWSVAFSPDGRELASASDDKTVRIWNAETGVLLQTLEGHTDSVWSVAFSPDGRRLASASGDETVRIWDAEIGTLQQTLAAGATTTGLSFSSNGCHLNTKMGHIALDQSPSVPIRTANYSGYGIDAVNRSWITWNSSKVLWLPQQYRPSIYEDSIIDPTASDVYPRPCGSFVVRKQVIAIGCSSGRVLLIGFNPNISPITNEPFHFSAQNTIC